MEERCAPDHDQHADCGGLDVPWARSPPARVAREAILRVVFGALLAYYTRCRTTGTQRLTGTSAPVLFVANHASHIDTPLILRALPRAWRRRTAVTAAADYFYADRHIAWLVSLVFNTVPVRREGGGLEHVEALLADRWSVLVYPQGTRSRGPDAQRLRTGAAVLAARHGLAIVPIRVGGTHAAMPPGQSWPRRRLWQRRHPVEVTFGAAIHPRSSEERHEVMERLHAFFDGQDALPARPETLAQARPGSASARSEPSPSVVREAAPVSDRPGPMA
ncbi:MAG TPA: lysophospholipid acyltransferase family protein [Solirubrobacteraceae bacterium]|nr:lysophospholipid acyltransferase family protein [Solirubrobacteraceae bacterium]